MTEYAFILTGQRPIGNSGFSTFTFSGTFKAMPGMTRQTALADIMAEAKKQYGIDDNTRVNIMFFYLEPNRLGGA